MLIAYLVFAIGAGTTGFFIAIVLGAPLVSAVAVYALTGAVSIGLLALRRTAMGAANGLSLTDLQTVAGFERADLFDRVAELTPLPSSARSNDGAMKILAVDDDAFILELIPKIAANVGHRDVTAASSAAEALDMLAKASEPFDCLLLDINMPGMDGIELCARVRSMPAYQDIPIIMLTAMSDVDHLDRAFRAGASDYTAKPFDIIEFGERLKVAQAKVTAKRASDALLDLGDAVEPRGRVKALDERGAPIPLVAALIQYAALENYLTRLSGSALDDAYVMAVVFDRDGEVREGQAALAQVATAIDAACGRSRYLMAYAGHGQFVLVADAATIPLPGTMEAAIQSRLNSTFRGSEPSLMVSVGMAVRPGSNRQNRARIACESAITLANDRAARRQRYLKTGIVRPSAQ